MKSMSIIFKNDPDYRRTTFDRRIIVTYTGLPSKVVNLKVVLNRVGGDVLSARPGARRGRLQA